MSIYENIRFPLRMRNVPKADQDALVRKAAAMVELGNLPERKPKALSGGQRQLQTTTIYVTHDKVEATTLADRIVVMNGGRIQQIGTPPMNLIQGRVENGAFVAPSIELPLSAAALAKKLPAEVILGVRPEDADVASGDAAQIKTTLFAVEPMGDHTLITTRIGTDFFTAKVDRDFRQDIDSPIAIRVRPDRVHLFVAITGERLQRGA